MSIFPVLMGFAVGVASLALPFAYPFDGSGYRIPSGAIAVAIVLAVARPAARFRRKLPAPLRPYTSTGWILAVLAALLLGYGYGHTRVSGVLDGRLPVCADAVARHFRLTILDTPVYRELPPGFGVDITQLRKVARFRARVESTPDAACAGLGTHELRMSWYDPPPLVKASVWQVEGKLRPPWGYRNPGGFDYERWLLGEGLQGSGYVRQGRRLQTGATAPSYRTELRRSLADWVEDAGIRHPALVLALMIGDDASISADEWQRLRMSGIIHLLVVSGLHVGLIAGLLYVLGKLFVRALVALLAVTGCRGWLQGYGSRRVSGCLAIAGSAAYVWLCGFGVPATRAWIMSSALLLAVMGGRAVTPFRLLGVALLVLLVLNPLAVHQQGLWLSFGAVAILLSYFRPRSSVRGCNRWWQGGSQFLRLQLVLFVAMAPMLAQLQSSVPMVSPLVNLFAVPLVSLLVLPLLLIIVVLHGLAAETAGALLRFADSLLHLIMAGAARGALFPARAMGLSGLMESLLMLTTLWLLGTRPGPGWFLLLLALWWALLIPDGRPPPAGEFRITALDVGQGSAILVDTHRHRLIFDAGPAFASGFDLGSAAVVPGFQAGGRQRLDVLVLSHADLDHTGGAAAILTSLQPETIWASFDKGRLPVAVDRSLMRCRRGIGWTWDGVDFRFLHPGPVLQGPDNDRSCVLLVKGPSAVALLPGDITARVERTLPKTPVDLLLAPHHGSATSSSMSFVRGFQPALVFVSTERRSRYGHPHARVLARYQGASVHITGREGALIWDSIRPLSVAPMRAGPDAYWRSGSVSH